MEVKIFKDKVYDTLKKENRLWNEEKTELNQTLLLDVLENFNERNLELYESIISLFLEDEEIKSKFFLKVKDVFVFKTSDFKFFMEENKVYNSFTQYKNRIGLTDGKRFLKDSADVVLNFPYKDCVLEGGQSTEEGLDSYYEYDETVTKTDEKKGYKAQSYNLKQSKRNEVFFNQILAKDEIDRLFDKKAFINWKRFTKDGEVSVGEIKRDEDGTIKENLIIKGNNLLALHSLKAQFKGKVKLIYIDPPYNTGSDSFTYNDRFNHSTWLTFMKNRLEIARELLREDGVIFVQCDDNEQAYLKVLMDEIFGKDNFISNSAVIINRGGRDYGGIAKTHEYLLIYGKTNLSELNLIEDSTKQFDYTDNLGGFNLMELRNRNIKFNDKNRPNLCYPFYVNLKNRDENGLYEISLDKQENYIEVYPLKSQGIQTVWRWGKEKVLKNINIEVKAKMKKDKSFMIVQKYRKNVKRQRSVWDDKNYVNEKGTLHIKNLFNEKVFDYPKSEFLLQTIIELGSDENDIVLDYHLGSGTTASASQKMNRQYIGIEQMEYIDEITKERLRKVVNGKDNGGISSSINWNGGGEFIYCELAPYNEKAKEEINNCKSLEELEKLFDNLYEKYFLNYNLKVKEFKEKVIKEENFKALTLEQQKEMFLTMLDLNQIYVQHSEMTDSKYGIDKESQKLTNKFYSDK
ncbi:site-specific DNA-methyltransferase [Aliarcobacter cryaerophilus]|uniref:site-specific DNA-methyltransferase n=1 Tax=Aliarcobacter cryaerophilus TaxID=28198 RepID=UPI00082683E0|nr:site-specific DNA-methyltransferase [Aliarcobacter cryaerophilus]